MDQTKNCSKCRKQKILHLDFYMCKGRYRSECKACTIKRNVAHQKEKRTWLDREVDEEARKAYMREYYAENKGKFAEYRKVFRMKYPEYYKEYFRKRKEKI